MSNALCANDHKGSKADKGLGQPLIPEVAHTLKGEGWDGSEDGTGRGVPLVMAPAFSKRPGQQIATRDDGSCFALTTGEPPRGLAADVIPIHDQATRHAGRNGDKTAGKGNGLGIGKQGDPSPTLTAGDHHAVMQGYAVRRLTPLECERLQGFPDGWTDVPHRGKPAADGPRYKSIGNSMANNVMRWIGERIDAVQDNDKEAADG